MKIEVDVDQLRESLLDREGVRQAWAFRPLCST